MRWTGMGMAIFNGMAALLLFAFTGQEDGTDAAPASRPDAKGASLLEAPPADGRTREVIEEIREIRRRLGIDPLAGSSLRAPVAPVSAAPEQDGASARAGDAVPDAADGPDDQFVESLRKYIPRLAARTEGEVVFQQPSPVASPLGTRPPSAPPAFGETLRATCRQLALRAEDLEQRRQYDEADRLRCLAQQLRLEARRAERGPLH